MLSWLRRQLAQRLGVTIDDQPPRYRTHLYFEQLEERNAPSAALLSDINGGPLSSAPIFLNGERWFTEVTSNGQTRVFFVAKDTNYGEELWMTDGTPGNAQFVKDISNQGAGDSSPRFLTNVNGTLFFAATDGQSGFELWKSDGTSNGTARVADIRQNGSSDPRFLLNVNGVLFFAANDGQNGFELWRSDGTPNGTFMVSNLNAGAASSNPHWLINAGGILFFSADPGGNPPGFQLYRLDPSTNNPTPVQNPTPILGNPNPVLRNPRWLAYFPSLQRLYFVAEERTSAGNFFALRLWYVDTQSASPVPQRVVNVSDPGNDGFFLTAVEDPTTNNNSFLFYRDRDPIFGIVLKAIDAANPPPPPRGPDPVILAPDPFDLYNHNGVLMFSRGPDTDREPAFVDTRGQTLASLSVTLLANINPSGPSLSPPIYFPTDFASAPSVWNYLGQAPTWYHWQSRVFFTTLGGTAGTSLGLLYFAADDGNNGVELWKANEALTAVNMVLTVNGSQIAPGARSAFPRFLSASAGLGSLLFSATGNSSLLGFIGEEPWVEIGPPRILRVVPPPAGTYRMKDILQFVLVMDKTTLVTGTPKLNITLADSASPNLQARNVQAIYTSGSGSKQLIFRYLVKRGDRDLDGIAITGPLDLSSGKITNIVGDQGDGNFSPSPQTFTSVFVDGIPPWVMQVRGPRPGTYGVGSILTFQLVTSEPVTVTPSGPTNQIPPYLNIRIGNVTRRAYFVGGSGTNILTFRYKVVAGDYAPEGIYIQPSQPFNPGTYQIRAPSITLAGPGSPPAPVPTGDRDLDPTIRTPVLFRVIVDTRGPRIADIGLPGLRNYVTGEVLEFRFRFNEKVYIRSTSSARPTLQLQIGNAVRQAALVSGHGTETLTFRYTVQANDQDLDGIRILGFSLPNGVRITDLAGNSAVLTFTHPDTRLIRVNVPTIRM